MPTDFAVITCHFNPCGFQMLRQNYHRFAAQMAAAAIPLFTVELVFDDDEFQIEKTERVFQLRTQDVLWFKENLLNIAVAQLPETIHKVAWIDADVEFSDPHWFQNAAQLLDQFKVIQLFSSVIDTDEFGEVIRSNMCSVKWAKENPQSPLLDLAISRPGFAWAARREYFTEIGLYERQIAGCSDSCNAAVLLRKNLHEMFFQDASPALQLDVELWGLLAKKYCSLDEVGYLDTQMLHHWHGSNVNRAYLTRQQIIARLRFSVDLGKRNDGLLCWTSETPALMKQQMRDYFTNRQEDDSRRVVEDIGLVTAVDSAFFRSFKIWRESVKRNWLGRIHVFDLGLKPAELHWLKDQGVTVQQIAPALLGKPNHILLQSSSRKEINLWWKPFLIDAAPFKRVIWIDADAVILTPLDGLLAHLDATGFTCYQERFNPPYTINGDVSKLLPHGVVQDPWFTPNAGVCAIDKPRRIKLLEYWKFGVVQAIHSVELRKRISCYDQGILQWALQALDLRDCIRENEGWNTPANNLTIANSAGRKLYRDHPGLLDEIKADHPDAHIVHWMGNEKLTMFWS